MVTNRIGIPEGITKFGAVERFRGQMQDHAWDGMGSRPGITPGIMITDSPCVGSQPITASLMVMIFALGDNISCSRVDAHLQRRVGSSLPCNSHLRSCWGRVFLLRKHRFLVCHFSYSSWVGSTSCECVHSYC